MQEIFKDIPNYEGIYQASNLGNIKSLSLNGLIIKMVLRKNGYFQVILWKNSGRKTFSTHQLIAMTFLNHIPCGMDLVINHINFDKTDNRVENLEIVTNRENCNHKHLKGTSKYVGVSWSKYRNKWVAHIRLNGKNKYLGYFNNEYDAHLAYQSKLN